MIHLRAIAHVFVLFWQFRYFKLHFSF